MPNTHVVSEIGFAESFKRGTGQLGEEPMVRDDFRSGEVIKIECLPGYEDPNQKYTKASCIGAEWHYTSLKCESEFR